MIPEAVAHWYLRLNGFFTITNFVVHPTRKGSQLTDGDIVGVRFPHRAEFPDGPGSDEQIFRSITDRPFFLIAEVKRGLCELNRPWRERGQVVIAALLQDLGPFAAPDVPEVTRALLATGLYHGINLYASLFFVGSAFDPSLPVNAPKKSWSDLLSFIYERFKEYRGIKADHEQWDPVGQELWRHFSAASTKEGFVSRAKEDCSLHMGA